MTHVNNFDNTILLRAIDPANAYHVTGVVNNVSEVYDRYRGGS